MGGGIAAKGRTPKGKYGIRPLLLSAEDQALAGGTRRVRTGDPEWTLIRNVMPVHRRWGRMRRRIVATVGPERKR